MAEGDRRYVVRLGLAPREKDCAAGVREWLDSVLHGGLERFAHAIDERGDGVRFFLTAAEHDAFIAALDGLWANRGEGFASRDAAANPPK